jgi:predicted ArsR family transcriptional regulator
MSDSQTVTIPAAQHATTPETRPVRLLKVLAQNPEPLSAPALASLLAEPGRRRRLLASCDGTLRRHEQAGRVERAGHVPNRRGRPAIIWRITVVGRRWLDEHDKASALAVAAAAEAQRGIEQAQRTATERDHALDEARATFNRQTPRTSRKRVAQQLRDLGCTLDQIGAVFHVSKERIRQDLLWDPAAHPPRVNR